MSKNVVRPLVPKPMDEEPELYKLSPGLVVGDLILLSGQLGFADDGSIPADPVRQGELVFDRLGQVLKQEGCDFSSLVSVTSYHVGSFSEAEEWWRPLVARFLRSAPFPVWASVEVAGLAVPGAVVEVSGIAVRRHST